MTLQEILSRVSQNEQLDRVLGDFRELPEDQFLNHRDVMLLSHYVRRLEVPSSAPEVEPLVEIVNSRFIGPLLEPGEADVFEPKSVVFGLEEYLSPSWTSAIRKILKALLAEPSLQTLEELVGRFGEKDVVRVLAALVARTPTDLYLEVGGKTPRGTRLPRVWEFVDSVVQGTHKAPERIGATAPQFRRPIELLADSRPHEEGWARLEALFSRGVPYELLILQRMVGTGFGTVQNASSELVASYLSDLFLKNYGTAIGLPFLRTDDGLSGSYPPLR